MRQGNCILLHITQKYILLYCIQWIQKVKEVIMSNRPKVAFSASLGSNGYFGPVNTDVTLVYKNVFINVGDAYQQATGIFIAPVRGVYYFSFFYHSGTKHGTGLALYRNGKHVALTKNNPSTDSPENGGNGLTLLYIWDSENVTVFSGFLINAM
uniref:C1q domain-containing protein n=1 Tax=Cyprinus carpio TaxID=7962 RepID=A0A8C1Y9W1_CYPCA